MFMDVRMCECIVCTKKKLINEKRVASGHQTFKILVLMLREARLHQIIKCFTTARLGIMLFKTKKKVHHYFVYFFNPIKFDQPEIF
jgi:hypothetical protein